MITLSIVSHGHDHWIGGLLRQLASLRSKHITHIIVTHNLPDGKSILRDAKPPFELTELFNPHPLGFGANHNQAFKHCQTEFFCILNPDLDGLSNLLFSELLTVAATEDQVLAYPVLTNAEGKNQVSAREVPTPLALLRRHLLQRNPPSSDWVCAAVWVLKAATFRELGGFDESYRMYCEDVDFCLRLHLMGGKIKVAPAQVIHHAQHASRRNWRHAGWHIASFLRLWTSLAFWRFLLTH